MSFKLISWNVNGLRAVLKNNFYPLIASFQPDILCLQETKLHAQVCPRMETFNHTYFHHSEQKKGYSGTAIFSQITPLGVRCIDVDSQHPEGRILSMEFKNFHLLNVYVPNSQDALQRLPYRTKIWDPSFRHFFDNLQKSKPLIICGDFNVAHQAIDLANPEMHHFHAGFTDQERASFDLHLSAGLVDVFRHLHPNLTQQYTWWSYRTRARERNIGWRLDYFLTSQSLLPHVRTCTILKSVLGSDHAPIQLELEDTLLY
ncbi:MAG: exodeoxyribonuclease III [Puniceicoccales bacterium]|jgi:exodeoxyribonuclease-3|nr:exodeoxyribonuclease III [Puniceicoccales bacterium]